MVRGLGKAGTFQTDEQHVQRLSRKRIESIRGTGSSLVR